MTPLPNPFIDQQFPRGFDVEAFMNAIDPPPMFLDSPSAEYLEATEIERILEVIARK